MNFIANILGLCAVVMFVLSYQMKTRKGIIFLSAGSRILYVAQYVLLGAFEGALLDIVAFFVSLLCKAKDKDFVKKHLVLSIVISNVFIVGMGMITFENIFSFLPILGVIFETLALWLNKEKNIRIVSIFGAPFWLAYNVINGAYGSAIGNVIVLVSICVAIIRYDILKQES